MAPSRHGIAHLKDDTYLVPFMDVIRRRHEFAGQVKGRLCRNCKDLKEFAAGHEYFGLHRRGERWVFREWAPNATAMYLVGGFSEWREAPDYQLRRLNAEGVWEIELAPDRLHHGDLYRLRLHWHGGAGDRIPAWARRVVQDEHTKIFNAQVWAPPSHYQWRNPDLPRPTFPMVYESHVGMAQDREGMGTYLEFAERILPRVADAGYNTVQLMAIMEHPYYGSFGYHVSSFFAASSRFGTPEELKTLIDTAHGMGLFVIMDLVHSHAVRNEVEGLSCFDGTLYQYFHQGARGEHPAWDSRCFDYGKPEVLHFLLSNCRYWIDEYRIDGFRFDGITSMMYHHRGLGTSFTSYDRYFDGSVDEDALAYLCLANELIHEVKPAAMTVAEDVSGMPGLAAPVQDMGLGFDYRLAMGVPDFWFKLAADVRDEDWDMGYLWHELVNRRADEHTVSYVESHDQALVGGKTMIFELIDAAMYHHMQAQDPHPLVDRGMALHKIMRLITLATAGHGYLNFMGNEFGHPEWIDFPREGNNWSYKYARRKWHLRDDANLKYKFLADFDRDLIRLARQHLAQRTGTPRLIRNSKDEKIIVFERAGMFVFCNFHPDRSVTDYAVEVPPGEYRLVLDTDSRSYGGHGRIEPEQRYLTQPVLEKRTLKHCVKVYLPCRTALVLEKVGAPPKPAAAKK